MVAYRVTAILLVICTCLLFWYLFQRWCGKVAPVKQSISRSVSIIPDTPCEMLSITGITPDSTLVFRKVNGTSYATATVKIRNNEPTCVAFKIKTKAPESYLVQPASATLRRGESKDVFIKLEKSEPNVVHDLFQLLATKAPSPVQLTDEMWKERIKNQSKISIEKQTWKVRLEESAETEESCPLKRVAALNERLHHHVRTRADLHTENANLKEAAAPAKREAATQVELQKAEARIKELESQLRNVSTELTALRTASAQAPQTPPSSARSPASDRSIPQQLLSPQSGRSNRSAAAAVSPVSLMRPAN